MVDGLDQALVNAGLGLLQADTLLTVYDGFVPKGAARPYVVVYTDLTRPVDPLSGVNALDGQSRHWTVAWYCHCVGDDAVTARGVAQRVRSALLDVRPVVSGLSCGQIALTDSAPPRRDETTGVLVMDALRVFELYASA